MRFGGHTHTTHNSRTVDCGATWWMCTVCGWRPSLHLPMHMHGMYENATCQMLNTISNNRTFCIMNVNVVVLSYRHDPLSTATAAAAMPIYLNEHHFPPRKKWCEFIIARFPTEHPSTERIVSFVRSWLACHTCAAYDNVVQHTHRRSRRNHVAKMSSHHFFRARIMNLAENYVKRLCYFRYMLGKCFV